jgi:predicted Mrr-cat superfamily restriction endonuclease
MKMVKIVTHYEDQNRAAELYIKEGLIAIGFVYKKNVSKGSPETIRKYFRSQRRLSEQKVGQGTSMFLRFRDEVEIGDIVFAYLGNNKIASVGEITGRCKFNDRNIVGNEEDGVGYPNQRKVKWWDKPRNFDRHFLPKSLVEWVAMPGTISTKQYDLGRLKKSLQNVPSQESVTKALEIHDENEIKDYMENHLEEVEKGLRLVKRENPTSEGPMDFLAKDKNNKNVVIEVKIEADESAIAQVRKYMRSFKKDKRSPEVRGLVVAEEFTRGCLDDADELRKLGMNIRLYKCKKKFGFNRLDSAHACS